MFLSYPSGPTKYPTSPHTRTITHADSLGSGVHFSLRAAERDPYSTPTAMGLSSRKARWMDLMYQRDYGTMIAMSSERECVLTTLQTFPMTIDNFNASASCMISRHDNFKADRRHRLSPICDRDLPRWHASWATLGNPRSDAHWLYQDAASVRIVYEQSTGASQLKRV